MIVRQTTIHRVIFAIALAALALVQTVRAAETTAFDLIKEGNRYLGEEAKDKVVQIRSEKSVGALTPNIWYVVYYDPDATFKATEVKFGAGKKLSVKRPARVLEFGTVEGKQLDRAKMKVDSDKALMIATAEPLLQNLKVNASQMWLQRGKETPGKEAPVVWKVRLWAVKLRNPERDADIGDVYISAEDGKVVRNDLHIDRVD
ncbi:MAG TPA: hypothetical protein VH598_02560 [Verrucomicrobiae bacterium]|nr:hypothetical protein [Verrucomicrobiae bacterium]